MIFLISFSILSTYIKSNMIGNTCPFWGYITCTHIISEIKISRIKIRRYFLKKISVVFYAKAVSKINSIYWRKVYEESLWRIIYAQINPLFMDIALSMFLHDILCKDLGKKLAHSLKNKIVKYMVLWDIKLSTIYYTINLQIKFTNK